MEGVLVGVVRCNWWYTRWYFDDVYMSLPIILSFSRDHVPKNLSFEDHFERGFVQFEKKEKIRRS